MSAAAAALLVLALLFAQSVELNHSHGADLRLQADCDICLKLGSDEDIAVGNIDSTTNFIPVALVPTVQTELPSVPLLSPQARAPPAA